MYSRSRMPPSEDRYRTSIPPFYSGSRFQNVRRERDEEHRSPRQMPDTAVPAQPESTPEPAVPAQAAKAPPEAVSVSGDTAPAPPKHEPEKPAEHSTFSLAGMIDSIGREELLLIGLLLLLSAEHERSMDVIVILLLLLGIR